MKLGVCLIRLLGVLLITLISQQSRAQNEFLLETTPLPIGRAFHGAAVLSDYLYVFGGSLTEPGGEVQIPTNSSQVSRIGSDGHLSRWLGTQPMALPRHYISNSAIVLNDAVYVLGGSDAILGGNRIGNVAYTRCSPNGLLEPWRMSQAFPGSGYSCTASFATPGYLHLTGGTGQDNQVSNQTWSVPILPDGTPGQWERGPSLPAPLWFHCTAVVGGRVFIWGGLNVDENGPINPTNKIYSAKILSSGKLGPWQVLPTELPVGMYGAQCAVAGPYLFTICPRYEGAERSNDIWWTYVTPQGMMPWKRQSTELPGAAQLATAQDYRRGIIYITGGIGDGGEHNTSVYMLRLSPEARRLAESQWQSTNAGMASSVSEFSARTGARTVPAQSTSSLPGFYSLDQGRIVSARKSVPMVLYFHIDAANPCKEQAQQFQDDSFSQLAQGAAFTSVDAGQYPQLAQQHGVFRVPTWIYFGSSGAERVRTTGVQTIEELGNQLSRIR